MKVSFNIFLNSARQLEVPWAGIGLGLGIELEVVILLRVGLGKDMVGGNSWASHMFFRNTIMLIIQVIYTKDS